MLLDKYLIDNDLSTTDFAGKIGKDRTFVARLRTGENGPSPRTMQKIIEVTGGQVTAADIHMARLAFQQRRATDPKPQQHRAAE